MKRWYITLTAREAARQHDRGLMTDKEYRSFRRLWSWAAPAFHGDAGALQDEFCRRYGYRAYRSRLNRVKRALAVCV